MPDRITVPRDGHVHLGVRTEDHEHAVWNGAADAVDPHPARPGLPGVAPPDGARRRLGTPLYGSPPGAGAALAAEARRQILAGRVHSALWTLDEAARQGSGAGLYLSALLHAVLRFDHGGHQRLGLVLGNVIGLEIDPAHVLGEMVPLYLRLVRDDPRGEPAWWLRPVTEALAAAGTPTPTGSADQLVDVVAADPVPFIETSAFAEAVARGRRQARRGDDDQAWNSIEAGLPAWRSDSSLRIAPLFLLFDPDFRTVVTPARARRLVEIPRQDGLARPV